MATYKITFSNGDAPLTVDGWLNVSSTLAAKYGHQVEIGHDGDLAHGGDRTMFWDAEDIDDDGTNALGSIYAE